MFLIDSHCHLDQINYKKIKININTLINKAIENNVKFFLTISTSINNFHKIKKLTKKNRIACSCGIHPLYVTLEKINIEKLELLANEKNVIAIGETGLDYFKDKKNIKLQQWSFRKHIQVAKKIKKPLIIHSRNSAQDTLKILKEENANICRGILHSFSEPNIEIARSLLNLGFYISFSGMITFKNTDFFKNIIQYIPIESILLETDSPYLSPVPHRGKENQPSYLIYIAKHISQIKKIEINKLAEITKKNFCELFTTLTI